MMIMMTMVMTWTMMIDDNGWTRAQDLHHSTQLHRPAFREQCIGGDCRQNKPVQWCSLSSGELYFIQRWPVDPALENFIKVRTLLLPPAGCLRLNPLASEHSAPAHFVLHRCVLACWSLFCNILICTGFPCARHSAAPACLVQGQIPKSSAPRTAVLRIKDYQDFDEKSPTTKQ